MATTPVQRQAEYTVDNLPPGFSYSPVSKRIYCNPLRSCSLLQPDKTVTTPQDTFANVNEYVVQRLEAIEQEKEKQYKSATWPDTYYEINLLYKSKIRLEKVDMICLIMIITGIILTLILVPVACKYLL